MPACKACGKDFVQPSGGARSYCSRACYLAHSTFPLMPCSHCGRAFHPRARAVERGHGYCGNSCRFAAKARPSRVCVRCKRRFEPRKCRQRFCSRRCHLLSKSEAARRVSCLACGKEFQHGSTRYCSRRCVSDAKRAASRRAACLRCGREFIRESTRVRYCSKECMRPRPRGCLGYRLGEVWIDKSQSLKEYERITKALGAGQLSLPSGWSMSDHEVQNFLRQYESHQQLNKLLPGEFAAQSGWPTDIGIPLVKVLNTLANVGVPMKSIDIAPLLGVTRYEICRRLKILQAKGLAIVAAFDARAPLYTLSPLALSHLERIATDGQKALHDSRASTEPTRRRGPADCRH